MARSNPRTGQEKETLSKLLTSSLLSLIFLFFFPFFFLLLYLCSCHISLTWSMSAVSCDTLGFWRPSTFRRRDSQSGCHSRTSWPGTGVCWLGIPQPWMVFSLRAPVQPWFLSQVRGAGWGQPQQPGAESRLCSSAGSCPGEPLGSLPDWSDKGDTCRESHLDCTAPPSHSQAGPAHREGLAHLPLSPLPLVSSAKEAFLALQINRRLHSRLL